MARSDDGRSGGGKRSGIFRTLLAIVLPLGILALMLGRAAKMAADFKKAQAEEARAQAAIATQDTLQEQEETNQLEIENADEVASANSKCVKNCRKAANDLKKGFFQSAKSYQKAKTKLFNQCQKKCGV